MNELVIGNKELTMSSREIADLVESRHDSVKRTIERLATSGVITLPPLVETSFTDKAGKIQWAKEYRLIKRDTYIVVAQLSPEFTARLVDRWQELEEQNKFLIPQTLPEALRLAADLADQNKLLQMEVEEIKPQAQALKRISLADGSMCITDAAKTLQTQPKYLFGYLSRNKWIYRRAGNKNWIAYQDKIQTGLLEHKVTTVTSSDGSERIHEQVLVTPKGIAKLARSYVDDLIGEAA